MRVFSEVANAAMSTSKRSREDNALAFSSSPSSSSPLKRSKTEPATISPKDLSGLFTNVLPSSVVSTPSRSVTRRMLAKSSTESNISIPPSRCTNVTTSKGLGQSMSLPTISLSPPPPEALPPGLSPSPLENRSKTSVRTYAQVRSFLMPLSLQGSKKEESDTDEDVDESIQSKESYSTLRTRLGVDHSEDNPFHVSGLNNDLSTITELRSKGEARRFLDEVGYLFEGLEAGVAPSVRRSSASEIVTNMCNPEFMRKAQATDFTSHVWDALAIHHPDKVLDFYIAVFIALIARDKRDIDSLCRKPGFFEVISRLMKYSREKDPILVTDTRLLKSVFTKPELSSLANLRQTVIMKSGIFSSDVSPSLRNLVSHTLTQIPISAIPSDLLFFTQQRLLNELDYLQIDIEAYSSNRSGFTPTAELHYIRKYLSLLDSTLMTRRIDGSLQEGLNTIQKPLISKLTMLYGATQCSDTRFSTLRSCAEELLRILINLSNLDSSWAALLSKEPMFIRRIVYEISTITEVDGLSTSHQASEGNNADEQCLALALLSNLVLTSDEIKDPLRETHINQNCLRSLECILQCECTSRTSALQILTSLFVKLRIKSESQNLLFFQVHVAALLCLLSIEHPVNHTLIKKDLKKENALLGPNGLKESILSFEKLYNSDLGSDAQDNTGPVDIQMQEQIKEACRSLCS